MKLAQAVGVPVGQRLGGELATMLGATINVIIYSIFFCFIFFSIATFSHKRSARIYQKPYFANVDSSAQKPLEPHKTLLIKLSQNWFD